MNLLKMLELVMEDQEIKLKDLQTLVHFFINFPAMWETYMKEFDDLKATAASVADLIGKAVTQLDTLAAGAVAPADVQALNDELVAAAAPLAAALAPATPAPTPEPTPTPTPEPVPAG